MDCGNRHHDKYGNFPSNAKAHTSNVFYYRFRNIARLLWFVSTCVFGFLTDNVEYRLIFWSLFSRKVTKTTSFLNSYL